MKNTFFSAVLLGSVLCMGLPSLVAQTDQDNHDNSFSHDMHRAGHDTADAGRDTGHGVEHGSKKVWHKTKHGTRKVTHEGAHKTDQGARHVENHTEPQ